MHALVHGVDAGGASAAALAEALRVLAPVAGGALALARALRAPADRDYRSNSLPEQLAHNAVLGEGARVGTHALAACGQDGQPSPRRACLSIMRVRSASRTRIRPSAGERRQALGMLEVLRQAGWDVNSTSHTGYTLLQSLLRWPACPPAASLPARVAPLLLLVCLAASRRPASRAQAGAPASTHPRAPRGPLTRACSQPRVRVWIFKLFHLPLAHGAAGPRAVRPRLLRCAGPGAGVGRRPQHVRRAVAARRRRPHRRARDARPAVLRAVWPQLARCS